MESAATNEELLDLDEIEGLGGGAGRKFYQVTDGKFVIKKDKQIQESHEKLLGRFERIGIETGTWKSGRAYHRLEVDFTGKDGPFSVSVDLIDPDGNFKAPVSAYHIARGFITAHFAVGDVVALNAWLGTPQKSHHHASNCVSVYRVVGKRADRIVAPKTTDTWDDLDAAIRELPGFAPRPKRQDAISGLAKLVAELKSRGWPTPADNPDGWLKLLRRIGVDEAMAPTIDKVADGTWEQVAVDIAQNAQPGAAPFPELVAAAAPKSSLFGGSAAKPAKSAAEEYDPYADQ